MEKTHTAPPNTDWEAQLGGLVPRLRRLSEIYSKVYDIRTLESSIRAADDAATWPLSIGQHAMYCIVQAIDMCEGIADLVTNEDGLQVPLAATYPLARAAIESASVALWMMEPESRRDRVLRRLQASHDELAFETAFTKSASQNASVSAQQAMLRANAKDGKRLRLYMKEIARANGIELEEYTRGMPDWRLIVETGGSTLAGRRGSLAVAAWRFTSGLTHPSFIRGRLAHDFVQTVPDSEQFRGAVTGNVSWLVSTASMGCTLTLSALTMLHATKGKVNGERPVPEPSRSP